MRLKGINEHVFVVNERWIQQFTARKNARIEELNAEIETFEAQIKDLEAKKAQVVKQIENLKGECDIPICYSCGASFESKMLCYSKRLQSYKQQLRCISCAVRYNLVSRTEYEFLVLGLEKHNRLKPEVMEIVKQAAPSR